MNGVHSGAHTYSFQDVCATLNTLALSDWKSFLSQHLLTRTASDAIAGLGRAGWQLTYSSIPSDTFLQDETEGNVINLSYSIGAELRPNGVVRSVMWDGPAFRAGLSPEIRVIAVNGIPFTRDALLSSIAASATAPLRLTLQDGEILRDARVPYAGPLRYPHLERIPNAADHLELLLAPR